MKQSAFVIAALAAILFSPVAPAQLLVNGSFDDSPDFVGWTLDDPSGFSNIGKNPTFSYLGVGFHANLATDVVFESLSQAVTTVPGQTYSLSFALANDGTDPANEFDVNWGDTLQSGVQVLSISGAGAFPYTVYSLDNLVATGTSMTLNFSYLNIDDAFRLDAVSLNVVPEVSTSTLAVIGFAILGLAYFRRAKSRRAVSV